MGGWGGGGGGGWGGLGYIGPKRPTLKSGRIHPCRNDPAETTHVRNDPRPKRPKTVITLRQFGSRHHLRCYS